MIQWDCNKNSKIVYKAVNIVCFLIVNEGGITLSFYCVKLEGDVYMKNKGLTLVELLAVIVILAVISLIMIPIIGNVIEDSRGKSFESSVRGLVEADGKLYIDNAGNVSLCLMNDKYYAYKNYNSGIYIGERKDNECIIVYDPITNKYPAMLDDGTGVISNVYSKKKSIS